MTEGSDFDKVMCDVIAEVDRAERKFPGFNSAHEGHSVLREEVEELWDHVKADTGYSEAAYHEAKQVAAMGMRYMLMVQARRTVDTRKTGGDQIGTYGE